MYEKHIFSQALYEKPRKMKGMRNILIHQYGNVDDGIVKACLKSEFLRDAREFVSLVAKRFD